MTDWLLPLAAGFGAGILSAWGVGGGTLLLLVMTLLLDVPQQQAAAVNLLYFLPTAAMGVVSHARNGLLEKNSLCAAVPWGAAGSRRRRAAGHGCGHGCAPPALRGVPAAGGRRQPAAAMAGTKAALTHIRQRIV